MSLEVNESYLYCAEDSPVISALTKVKILHIWNFPATGKVFLTIEDLENKNIDRHGKEEGTQRKEGTDVCTADDSLCGDVPGRYLQGEQQPLYENNSFLRHQLPARSERG